ncbi:MAG: leucine-rich repeat protein [Clostridia bacterium]|nr:leucine-rich repeat protein [Clostridia bacterium]
MNKCTQCGAEFEGKFCPECGTKTQEETKICPKCKTQNSFKAKFCPNCGQAFEEKKLLTEPVKPTKVDKPKKENYNDKKQYKQHLKAYNNYKMQACAYKHDKRRYDKGKDGSTPAAVVWLDVNKLWLSIAVLALVAVIVISCVISSALSNIFRIGKVSRIELGFTQEQVRKILGEPYSDENSKDFQWVYFDDTYMSVIDKLNKNSEAQEKAILSDNESKLMSLLKEEEQLLKELESLEFKYIEVNFTIKSGANNEKTYIVSNVFFDPKHSADETKTDFKKELKSVKLSSDEINYYIDNTLEDKTVILKDSNGTASYTAEFKDGSWLRSGLYNEKTELNGESATISWTDKYSDYSLTGKAVKIGEVTANGVWKAVKTGSALIDDKIEPHNTSVISLTIPSSVTEIGEYGFSAFTNLKSITFHDNITKIGKYAFGGCESLEALKLPENLEEIGENAFSHCSAVKAVVIPDSVEELGNYAFNYCTALEEITLGANTHISNSLGEIFSGCNNLTALNVSENNKQFRSENNCIIRNYGSDIDEYLALGCKTSVIPNSVTIISPYAFYNCKGITQITLPDSVTKIRSNAFSGSGITGINLANIVELGSSAFEYCENLKTLTIPAAIEEIPNYLCNGCTSLEKVTIESGIAKIGHAAFNGCDKLNTVNIPASVVYFDNLVFGYCKNLKNINFGGTKAQWNAIEIGGSFNSEDWKWNYNTGNYKIICTDGEIKK